MEISAAGRELRSPPFSDFGGSRQALGHLFGIRPPLIHQKQIEFAGTIFQPLGNDMHDKALAL
jgi:hypothetical protein